MLAAKQETETNTIERDVMEYDVVTVGAGPAGLAFAIRLKQLNPALSVCVIEKSSTIGAHILSGAVIEPAPLDSLLPGWRNAPPPICVPATEDEFWLLSKNGAHKFPIMPPSLRNHGNVIVSLGALCAWLAPQAETLGVDIYPGFSATETLHDAAGQVIGVRIGDMGIAKNGTHKPNFTPGIAINAKVTVLAEGARGHLTKHLIKHFSLDQNSDPQTYSIGIKELWHVPEKRSSPGKILHTLGWPANTHTYGGGFLYHLNDNRIALGYVSGLDYHDPMYEPWEAFQQWKNHPLIKPLLESGDLLSGGARAIVTGGWQSLPKVDMPGALLIGDTAGLLNVPKIKGTHQAIRSGMLAAEHLVATQLTPYGFDAKLRASKAMTELKQVRNIKPGFKKGLWLGLLNAAWETATRGASPWTLKNTPDWAALQRLDKNQQTKHDYVQRTLPPRDRLHSVYFAATVHNEDQPIHLKVTDPERCVTRCVEEYGNPCTRFCPANVYQIIEDPNSATNKRLHINAANCVHCKTCDIKDPYQIIDWITPEGGSGPNYQNL
ncbi:electron transfer flavoprotein-ubiquinone oxidoreductase [Xylella fastidiosa subsp. multiplex]|uniref:Electron transfer flavoprotein-ubiquinone oxidoreductase n=1 Tax=Xylella fastidiosa subsp. multiplex TaxID=644357 RepID=A0AAW6HUI7_XYLFS|nr:electron transfer flavoprotein-ubiquinone oxidoreductase [Xylella fastidiosa]ERI59777.1 electron transfer flavoprotein [Xylella fastidiosa subsp. multiplex Griffin-1]ACA11627.1 Electron-transferring-flavoprotein dehydrogenase [Xylella fastidiosa M12]KAJ4852228.1 electron transfer flavoprotein-ubiquinone oxidoreductase [Xylella fastidiosa subsp. multiplex]MBS9446218.1 electron transfer flavoprotein-ubiquinone oxidoreductase [Xylella fastidiosa subsp. multiplex]MBS9448148.1 electron transfer 